MFARKGCKQGRRGAFILGEYMADPGFSRARAFVFQIQIRCIQKRITFNWRKKKNNAGIILLYKLHKKGVINWCGLAACKNTVDPCTPSVLYSLV